MQGGRNFRGTCFIFAGGRSFNGIIGHDSFANISTANTEDEILFGLSPRDAALYIREIKDGITSGSRFLRLLKKKVLFIEKNFKNFDADGLT